MDSSIIAAISAILGTTVGGLSTFATTLLNQRYAMRRDILAKDVANREQLYSEFLKEVGNLYFDSVNRTLQDTSQQASLIRMYSLVGRIRMISSEAVLTSAEKLSAHNNAALGASHSDLVDRSSRRQLSSETQTRLEIRALFFSPIMQQFLAVVLQSEA